MHDEFTFQYVSIISLIVPAGNSFTAIYIPICFYYFEKLVTGKIYKSGIYIPICFYYFYLLLVSKSKSISFTFQYVSIISDCFSVYHFDNLIYIPICFYYFCSKGMEMRKVHTFTFQYVSIISCIDY